MSMPHTDVVPAALRATCETVTQLTDAFCREHLDDEYALLARRAARALCCQRPSLLIGGQPRSWACGIMHALGMVNFLFDPSQAPHLSASRIYEGFGVSESNGGAKSRAVRDALDMVQMDPRWYRPSQMAANVMAWMVMIDGMVVDVRHLPRNEQVELARRGVLPHVAHLILGEGTSEPASSLPATEQTDAPVGDEEPLVCLRPVNEINATKIDTLASSRRARRDSLPSLIATVITAVTAESREEPVLIEGTCIRRPNRRACGGRIVAGFLSGGREIAWECSSCGDTGLIHDWQRSSWDRGGRVALPSIRRIRYWRGMLDRLRDRSTLRPITLEGDAIPRELVVAIHDDRLLEESGEHGDVFAGRPLQFERLSIELADDNVDIVLYNRALMLLHTADGIYPRLHRACVILERLANSKGR